jgi:hypothetical protein
LCTGRVSLVVKLRLNDHFPQNIFSPLGNENVGRGTRALSESGFKVTKKSPPSKIIANKILIKINNYFFALEKTKIQIFFKNLLMN